MTGPADRRNRDDVPMPDESAGLDDLDQEILDRIRGVHSLLDGPPPGFDERMVFALAARGLDTELARLEEDAPAAARGAEEIARTLSFEASSLSILLTIGDLPDDRVRIDGWLAPVGPMPVELRVSGAADRRTVADDGGRFVFDGLHHGLVQIVARPLDGPSVVTPAFEL